MKEIGCSNIRTANFAVRRKEMTSLSCAWDESRRPEPEPWQGNGTDQSYRVLGSACMCSCCFLHLECLCGALERHSQAPSSFSAILTLHQNEFLLLFLNLNYNRSHTAFAFLHVCSLYQILAVRFTFVSQFLRCPLIHSKGFINANWIGK